MSFRSSLCALRAVLNFCRFFAAGALIVISYWWLVSSGTWVLSEKDWFSSFFDMQMLSIRAGTLKVPCWAPSVEAFYVNGGCVGYFGITPSLLRWPLDDWMIDNRFMWSRWMILGTALGSIALAMAVQGQMLRDNFPRLVVGAFDRLVLGLAVAVASPLLFLVGRSFVYEEALTTGLFFTLAALWFLLRFVIKWRLIDLMVVVVLTFLAVHARVTMALGLLATMGVLALILMVIRLQRNSVFTNPSWASLQIGLLRGMVRRRRLLLLAQLTAGFVLVIIGSYLFVTYAKFGNFNGMPLEKNIQAINKPKRLENFVGNFMVPSNLIHNLFVYFDVTNTDISDNFPWITPASNQAWESAMPWVRIDQIEPLYGVPLAYTVLFPLALGGLVVIATNPRQYIKTLPFIISFSSCNCILLIIVALSYRYEIEFLPLLLILSTLGYGALRERLAGLEQAQRLLRPILLLLLGLGGWANFGAVVALQRDAIPPPVPEQAERWAAISDMVDRLTGARPSHHIAHNISW